MPDLANRADHEASLLAAIQPVFVSLAAQGERPDWGKATIDLIDAITPVLQKTMFQARSDFQKFVPEHPVDGEWHRRAYDAVFANARIQAATLAADLIATRREAWQAAREKAAEIETPDGEETLSQDAVMLYLLYGLPKRSPFFPDAGQPDVFRLTPTFSDASRRLTGVNLTPSWETHLAQYVPADGRGLVAEYLGPERAESIAVTEVTKANSRAERAAAEDFERATGVRIVAYWVTESDSRVCATCEGLGGKAESVWLREMPDGPPAHPNCRCWLDWRPEE